MAQPHVLPCKSHAAIATDFWLQWQEIHSETTWHTQPPRPTESLRFFVCPRVALSFDDRDGDAKRPVAAEGVWPPRSETHEWNFKWSFSGGALRVSRQVKRMSKLKAKIARNPRKHHFRPPARNLPYTIANWGRNPELFFFSAFGDEV